MPDLEQIVRPSQFGDVRPSNIQTGRAPQKTPNTDEIVWGAAGNTVFQLTANSKAEVNNTTSVEIKRTFDTVRIKSPDDPSVYVDVEVMTQYQSRNQLDKSRSLLRFTPPTSTPDAEVISRNQTRTSPDNSQ